ncbi:alpha-L-glutamate ligase-like protein [Agaribacterium haliotis]|uniref:alpha-L-glutamate ligase-like protein n=1 Tax=Agaribacterium haliotis TaxID=2013869 RepID=UPI001EFD1007|nr:alpha-L-glutamate ligase-like protein [Agaribacterium haliotis]
MIALWWRRWLSLKSQGVLGMNRRNHHYISRYNDRALYPTVDNKLLTKQLALEFGLTTPELIGVVDNQHDVRSLAELLAKHSAFCIKPAKGSGGKGILVITDSRLSDNNSLEFCKSSGEWLSLAALQRHVSNILAGLFSLGGATDVAMVESLLRPESSLENYSFQGVPDIRVIVFRGIPVMAMIRLACSASHGKANLHQGAIGVGLDIHSGRAINAVQNDDVIDVHPDTGVDLMSLSVPHWDRLLELAMACQEISGLGYLGVDLVIDQHAGPTLLELNARPGLSIQIANGAGLIPRLKAIELINKPELMSRSSKLDFARAHF